MYKIPEDFDFSCFKGKTLNQISFGLNVIIIFFSTDIFIQWSGSFKVFRENLEIEYDEVYPVTDDSGLLNFLEKTVINVYSDEDRCNLFLTFEDNSKIVLCSDSGYESFSLNVKGIQTII